MKEYPLVSIIAVNYNGKKYLKDCFGSLYNLNYPPNKLEIIMVDNGSSDSSTEFVKENFPRVKIIKNNINNYCKANNLGLKHANGEYAAILNNDTKVDKDWLVELVKVIIQDKNIGAVGSKILFTDGRIQSVGHVEFPYHYWGDRGLLEEDMNQYNQTQEVESVSNCSVLYRRKALNDAGLFDEDFVMYMEDVDMAFRLKRKKWKIVYAPYSIVYHIRHGSGQDLREQKFYVEKNRLLFIAKYFPEKLPELMFGNGEITRLSPVYFQSALLEVFNKLIKLYGSKEAERIFSKIDKNLKAIQEYNEHCLRIESEMRIIELKNQIIAQNNQIKSLQDALAAKDKQIDELKMQYVNQIKSLQDALAAKDRIILEKEQEITSIYDSESYRFVVRPIIWPILSLSKRVNGIFKAIINKISFGIIGKPQSKKFCIHIAQLYARNIEAQYMGKNEYTIKLINTAFQKESAKLVVDIRAYRNPVPESMHYSCFSTEIALKPRSQIIIQLVYDWERNIEYFAEGNKLEIKDFWRGELLNSELYTLEAKIYNNENRIIDSLRILQRLKK